ncbi:hypothetical protein [Tunicatimonas pelagia]|nr:hypothetical protein [Tunicatimonas pelagia]WKN45058.1 hypothetical protein P0M28_08780 [Tunicatimonas pelagia]
MVQQLDHQTVEVATADSMASMQAMENESLTDIATKVQSKLKHVIDAL